MSDAIGSLLSPVISLFKPDKPKALPKPRPLPSQDDAEVQRAKKASYLKQRTRSGRASTVLTERETLG